MKLTTNKALSLLGNIALLNEEIMEFMFWCYCDSRYSDINALEHEIMDERFRAILYATVDIKVEYHHALNVLSEAYHAAVENNDLKNAKKIKSLSNRLLALMEETEEENKE